MSENLITMTPYVTVDIESQVPLGDQMTIDNVISRGPTLYKYDATGKLRVWYMEQNGNKHRVVSGHHGGQLVTSEWTVCTGKQKRTDEEQAFFEVQSGYTYNLEREYFRTPQEAEGGARFFKPMLAEKWKDCGWTGAMEKLAKSGFEPAYDGHTGFFYQHKFDGFCCIATIDGLQSREGKPIIAVPHIMEALKPYFDEYPNGVLHGELYSHDLKDNFQKLVSLLKKQKDIKPEQYAEAAAIVQYHVYDNPAPHARADRFSERHAKLYDDLKPVIDASNGVIQLAETWAVRDEDHLRELMGQSLELGYEGGIGRLDLGEYVQKRSWQVLKIKEFDDAEFEVAKIEEGKGNYTGHAKKARFWLPGADRSEGPNDKNTFGAGIKGGLSKFNKDLLANPESQKVATVRYFGVSNDGVPRFPVVHVWHGEERTL